MMIYPTENAKRAKRKKPVESVRGEVGSYSKSDTTRCHTVSSKFRNSIITPR
jgi:hypothetical protein